MSDEPAGTAKPEDAAQQNAARTDGLTKKSPLIRELAQGLKINPATVWRYVQRGMPTTSIAEARSWRAANIESKSGRQASATTRLREAQARNAELDAARKAGELAPLEEYRSGNMDAMAILTTGLSGFPGRVAGRLATMTDAAEIKAFLRDEINVLRTECADALDRWIAGQAGVGSGRGDDAPGADPIAGSMGERQASPPAG